MLQWRLPALLIGYSFEKKVDYEAHNSMEHEIVICMGSSCFARGNKRHLVTIEQYLAGHGLADSVCLSGSRCEDHCCTSPNICIDGNLYSEVTEEALPDLLNRHLAE